MEVKEILRKLGVVDINDYNEVLKAYSELEIIEDDFIRCHGEGMYQEELWLLEEYMKQMCKKHEFEQVAYNGDWGEYELYDCICKHCGFHAILPIEETEEGKENEEYRINNI